MTSSLAGMILTSQAPRKHLSSQPFLALGCLPSQSLKACTLLCM